MKESTENEIIKILQQNLKEWGGTNRGEYPWRYISDPYKILISEFMLHRTQAGQAVPVYGRFIIEFPELKEINTNEEQEMREIMKPLGLRWRTNGMIRALKELHTKYGLVPTDIKKLSEIKGIGPYIAGATCCFATNTPAVLIDTNVVRVLGRMFGLNLQGEPRRRKEVAKAVERVVDVESPRDFYYTLIDFSHQVCRPRKPHCNVCPLAELPCANKTKV